MIKASKRRFDLMSGDVDLPTTGCHPGFSASVMAQGNPAKRLRALDYRPAPLATLNPNFRAAASSSGLVAHRVRPFALAGSSAAPSAASSSSQQTSSARSASTDDDDEDDEDDEQASRRIIRRRGNAVRRQRSPSPMSDVGSSSLHKRVKHLHRNDNSDTEGDGDAARRNATSSAADTSILADPQLDVPPPMDLSGAPPQRMFSLHEVASIVQQRDSQLYQFFLQQLRGKLSEQYRILARFHEDHISRQLRQSDAFSSYIS